MAAPNSTGRCASRRRYWSGSRPIIPLAPSHQPQNLAPIRSLLESRPDLPQIACFDTAFHRTQPRLAQLFPLPRAFAERGVLRYGFHGLSYQFIAQELRRRGGARAEGRVIVAHLGHGASLCAMRGLASVATTMGFTALDGLMMGTRSGAIDPGLLLHLIMQEGMTPAQVHALLYQQSGLLGVSGVSDDLRVLEADGSAAAEEAMALFAYRAAREIGSLASAIGGLDMSGLHRRRRREFALHARAHLRLSRPSRRGARRRGQCARRRSRSARRRPRCWSFRPMRRR